MSNKPVTFRQILQEELKNPAFRWEWEESEAAYQVGRQIIQARIEQNLSQRELAKKAKTTQAVISRIESLSVNPSIKLLDRIARALGKTLQIRFI